MEVVFVCKEFFLKEQISPLKDALLFDTKQVDCKIGGWFNGWWVFM